MSPSEPDHLSLSPRARTHLQPSTVPRRKPRPPRPFCSRHRPRSLRRSPRPVRPLPPIKSPLFFPEKIPLTSLYLLDIISSIVARRSRPSFGACSRSRRSSVSLEPPPGRGGRGGAPTPDCSSPSPLVASPSIPATAPFLAVGEFVRPVSRKKIHVRTGSG
jgi:hypothetical protein